MGYGSNLGWDKKNSAAWCNFNGFSFCRVGPNWSRPLAMSMIFSLKMCVGLSLGHPKKSLVPRSQSTAMLQGHRIKGIVISSRIIQVPFLSGRLFGPEVNVLSAACWIELIQSERNMPRFNSLDKYYKTKWVDFLLWKVIVYVPLLSLRANPPVRPHNFLGILKEYKFRPPINFTFNWEDQQGF